MTDLLVYRNETSVRQAFAETAKRYLMLDFQHGSSFFISLSRHFKWPLFASLSSGTSISPFIRIWSRVSIACPGFDFTL